MTTYTYQQGDPGQWIFDSAGTPVGITDAKGVNHYFARTSASGGISLIMPDSTTYPLTGTLLSVTTLNFLNASAALTTNAVLPFDSKLRDDLGVGDVTTNIGRITIPAAARYIKIVAGVGFGVSEGGTYRRINFNIVANGTTLSSVTTPSVYTGIKPMTCPVIGTQTPSLSLVSSSIDITAWPVPATVGASYIELKVQHDGTAGTGAQATIAAGSFFSVEFLT